MLYRKSRLRDEKGNFSPLGEIVRLPIIIYQAILKKLFHYYPSSPCIVHGARKALNSIINTNMRIVEFGSGQSTLWYAKRCQQIISHETTDHWFEKVTKNLSKEKYMKISYCLKSTTLILLRKYINFLVVSYNSPPLADQIS